jgi:putative endonuclease
MTGERQLSYYVYLLSSRRHGTVYPGVANDLVRRVYQHKCHNIPGFTARYTVDRLVWFEIYDDPAIAIAREEAIKKMAAGLEDRTDRRGKFGVAGSLRSSSRVMFHVNLDVRMLGSECARLLRLLFEHLAQRGDGESERVGADST